MRKLMVLVAMLAVMLGASSPAFAQAVAIDEGDDVEFNAVAQNIAGGFGDVTQSQSGTANATATGDSAAAAEVSQEQDFLFLQFNSALNDF